MRETTDYWKQALQEWQDQQNPAPGATSPRGVEDGLGLLHRS